ncbi:hypothetical protein [Cryobacterium tepidiphilum]|uniref:Uncharacterized protein n=1 Tax=Cryobacterium tepidiphilum TaxID=2486026 RepID=A0A3M8LBW7_9MICO|nr:hypothetical protein [Cryobacterium tepidiphilum]RNE62272.1 hypothetical protein EEJ31_08590 [Cryobacterium tepidiphilum]
MSEAAGSETTARRWRLGLVVAEAFGWVLVASGLPVLLWVAAGVVVQAAWVTVLVVAVTVIGGGLVVAARFARRATGASRVGDVRDFGHGSP